MANPDLPTGARGSSDASASLAGDAPESIPVPIKLQAIPEREAEHLAFGYGSLSDDHLEAARAKFARAAVFEVFRHKNAIDRRTVKVLVRAGWFDRDDRPIRHDVGVPTDA